MFDMREKYGEWGIILGATEGVGKAIAEKAAQGKMNVVLVGRREEKLKELGEEIKEKYKVEYKVVKADLSEDNCTELIFKETENLDMGFMSYVACLHKFGKLQDTPMEDHMKMLNVNIISFLKCFHHYMGEFAEKNRGFILNISSLTAITGSPYNGQYGAGKSYIKKLTEAVAYEAAKTGVDVMVATLGTTLTPTLLRNTPGGDDGSKAMKNALTPEQVADIIFDNVGKVRSLVVGTHNQETVRHWQCDMSADEAAAYMGSFYEK